MCICVHICVFVYLSIFVWDSSGGDAIVGKCVIVYLCIYLYLCGIRVAVMQLWASQATGSAAPIPPSHSDASQQIVYSFVTYNSIPE